jgi:iron(III) transport system ATP-binding protein
LSGGQQQRVALARALATSPGLLLLDEPLSALDARVRARLRHEVKGLQRRLGITTIMVTHDQEEALTMADRIVVMNHGSIEQVGTPRDIYMRPATPFVADFVGTMNFLAGKVEAPGRVVLDGRAIACDTGTIALGQEVQVCLRPEDVRVRGVAPGDANVLEVEITDMEFLGAFCRAGLAVAPGGGQRLSGDFSSNLIHDLGLAPGQRLSVALPADRLVVYTRG